MSQTRLFDVAKVGCFCDAIGHSVEKRRGEEVKILTLTLRVAPFDSKLAGTMPDGIKPTLFKLNSGDPKEGLRRADFALGLERQLLRVFAAPDTDAASIALDQVKVTGTYARSQKDRNGFDFVFKASFGPCDKNELEYVQAWLLTQRFVTFEQAEPGMFDDGEDDDQDEPTDADEKAAVPANQPMWEDGDEKNPQSLVDGLKAAGLRGKREPANRKLHSHANKKKPAGKARSLRRGRR